MSITAPAPTRAGVDDLAGLDGLDGLDAAGVLAAVAAADAAERRDGVAKLELTLQWCVLHPATVKQWLGDTQATIVPVVHLDRDDPVAAHDPPAWMRELVTLRDRHCVFPWSARDARTCDLDHIEPYQPPEHPPDHRGPPGQTRPTNVASRSSPSNARSCRWASK